MESGKVESGKVESGKVESGKRESEKVESEKVESKKVENEKVGTTFGNLTLGHLLEFNTPSRETDSFAMGMTQKDIFMTNFKNVQSGVGVRGRQLTLLGKRLAELGAREEDL